MAIEARRLTITGRVQGVWFRDWTVAAARAAGVRGWVRNRRDGSVEVLAIGDRATLDGFAARCRTGPPRARVDAIAVTPAAVDAIEAVAGFERRADL